MMTGLVLYSRSPSFNRSRSTSRFNGILKAFLGSRTQSHTGQYASVARKASAPTLATGLAQALKVREHPEAVVSVREDIRSGN